MVGGIMKKSSDHDEYASDDDKYAYRSDYFETKRLWSALSGGSSTLTWTRCDTPMNSRRRCPMVVPLHDGRIFICGGTATPRCWIEIYDPEKGEFDTRDLPEHISSSWPSSCFELADQLVMMYYDCMPDNKNDFENIKSNPSLLLYDVGRNNWDIFADNLPKEESGLYNPMRRNLVYVGGNILFIIDQASCWFVYDLSAKKMVGKMDVMVEDGGVIQAFYLRNNDIKCSSWTFYIFVPNEHRSLWGVTIDLRYSKVEVVQGKGGNYISRVHSSGILRVGRVAYIEIIASKVSHKIAAEKEKRDEDDK